MQTASPGSPENSSPEQPHRLRLFPGNPGFDRSRVNNCWGMDLRLLTNLHPWILALFAVVAASCSRGPTSPTASQRNPPAQPSSKAQLVYSIDGQVPTASLPPADLRALSFLVQYSTNAARWHTNAEGLAGTFGFSPTLQSTNIHSIQMEQTNWVFVRTVGGDLLEFKKTNGQWMLQDITMLMTNF